MDLDHELDKLTQPHSGAGKMRCLTLAEIEVTPVTLLEHIPMYHQQARICLPAPTIKGRLRNDRL